MRKLKNGFLKICLALRVSGSKKNGSFVHTICLAQQNVFGPKQSKSGKTIKERFQQKLPRTKMTVFLKKCFLGWVKNVVFFY